MARFTPQSVDSARLAGGRAGKRASEWKIFYIVSLLMLFPSPLAAHCRYREWACVCVCSLHITYTMRTPNTITHDSDEKWITFLHPFRRWIELWMCTNMMKAKAQKTKRNETTTTSMSTVVRARQFIRIIENLNRFLSFSKKRKTKEGKKQSESSEIMCARARVVFIACESTLDTRHTSDQSQSHRSSEFLQFVVVCGRAESRSNIWICILRRLLVFPVGWASVGCWCGALLLCIPC